MTTQRFDYVDRRRGAAGCAVVANRLSERPLGSVSCCCEAGWP
jgi:hypothetical protein